MQQSPESAEELISLRDAAREIGINVSTLSRQVKSGAVRSHDGKVRLSEVLEDRANNIDLTQSRRRPKGEGAQASATAAPTARPDATTSPVDATTAATPTGMTADRLEPQPHGGALKRATKADVDDTEELVLVDGIMVPLARAAQIKENYLARTRQLLYERDRRALVSRVAAEALFFTVARENRDAWLSWPARVVTLMASELKTEESALLEVLTQYVHQHLAELGEPATPDLN
jgi:hypothetical protein